MVRGYPEILTLKQCQEILQIGKNLMLYLIHNYVLYHQVLETTHLQSTVCDDIIRMQSKVCVFYSYSTTGTSKKNYPLSE